MGVGIGPWVGAGLEGLLGVRVSGRKGVEIWGPERLTFSGCLAIGRWIALLSVSFCS